MSPVVQQDVRHPGVVQLQRASQCFRLLRPLASNGLRDLGGHLLSTGLDLIDQTVNNQLEALRDAAQRLGWEVVAEYTDRGISGAKGRDKRPQFDQLLKAVTRGEVDLIASWSVDRLGRSLTDLLAFLSELHAKGCNLFLHQQGLDTSTPAGRAMFQMMGVFAEFEREMIRERVTAGLRRAKAAGVVIGRPRVSEDVERRIRAMAAEGMGKGRISRALGCGVSTVQRVTASAT